MRETTMVFGIGLLLVISLMFVTWIKSSEKLEMAKAGYQECPYRTQNGSFTTMWQKTCSGELVSVPKRSTK